MPFAKDIAGGLLDKIAEKIENLTEENKKSVEILEKHGIFNFCGNSVE